MKSVFISGIFEFIQPGHIRLFKYAKEIGDTLIIGIFADSLSDNNLKFDEKQRSDSLKSNRYVDQVVIINKSLEETLNILKPNIVLKGSEFSNLINPESKFVNSYGGKLLFNSGDPFYSIYSLEESFPRTKIKNSINHDTEFLTRNSISLNKLSKKIESFKDLNGAVVGDMILDEYIECEALGLSREDFHVIYSPINRNKYLGGAAIVAEHCAAFCNNVSIFSQIGPDSASVWIRDNLTSKNLKNYFMVDEYAKTTLKKRYKREGVTVFRNSNLNMVELSKSQANKLLKKFELIVKDLDFVILCDFGYGTLTNYLVENIINLAKKHQVFIAADAQTSSQVTDVTKYSSVDLMSPTEFEVRTFLKSPNSGLADLSKQFLKKTSLKNLILTLGRDGVIIDSSENLIHRKNSELIKALNYNPVDTSGAGDSLLVLSTLSYVLDSDLLDAAYLGSIASAIQISSFGNKPIAKKQIQEVLEIQ